MSRWVALAALASLLLSSASLRAAESVPDRCGFAAGTRRIQSMSAGVPLLFAASSISADAEAKVTARRKRLLGSERRCMARYPNTARYVRSVLTRLVQGSGLEAFAASIPSMEVVFDCSQAIPLPIAMATGGKLMLVSRALPGLAASEDAIAAVLGHELAHLSLRHAEQLTAAVSAVLPLSRQAARELKRTHEREADITGLKLLVSAGYDPVAALDHMRQVEALALELQRAGKLSPQRDAVHDSLALRLHQLDSQIAACGYPHAAARTPVALDVRAELTPPDLERLDAVAGP